VEVQKRDRTTKIIY